MQCDHLWNNRTLSAINGNTFIILRLFSWHEKTTSTFCLPIDGLTIATGRFPLCSTKTCSARALVNVYVLGRLPIIL